MEKIKKLFEPIRVGQIELKNRIKFPALAVGYDRNGEVTEQTKAFYHERAKGGVGLIGLSCIAERQVKGKGLTGERLYGLSDDRFIPGLHQVVEVCHAQGAKVYTQVGSGYTWSFRGGPVEFVSPSGITATGKPGVSMKFGLPKVIGMPRMLSIEEIHLVAEDCGEAARRAREAGFDAYEIIASTGYLFSQFLSPVTNKRTDEYGGSLENRARILLKIVDNIKKKAGEDYTILFRLSGSDFLNGGYSIEDTRSVARMLEKAGVHEFDILPGWHNSPTPFMQKYVSPGAWTYLAEQVQKSVRVPVAAGTTIYDPLLAEQALVEGRVKMVYMARSLIADPDLPNKAKEGNLEDIRPCIACCNCLDTGPASGGDSSCTVNARAGKEEVYSIKTADRAKRVLIIGGGPGGLEASRVAALRGHKVTLYEKGPRIGGSMILAAIINRRIEKLIKYLETQINKLPIEIKLRTEANPDLIKKVNPDVVILAIGGDLPILNVPGSEKDIVFSAKDVKELMSYRPPTKKRRQRKFLWSLAPLFLRFFHSPSVINWLLKFNFPFGSKVAIIGGGFAACELGELLSEKGKKVVILTESESVGTDIGFSTKWVVMKRLKQFNAKIERNGKIVEITDKGVKFERAGSSNFIEADTVVLTGLTKLDGTLAQRFGEMVSALYSIGDCAEPRKIINAMDDAYRVAIEI
jgi:2,4-dienoyl-CoA reductase (NADPH2)